MAAGLGVEPAPEFAAACWQATGGTPFLVRTLIEALRDERIAPLKAATPKVEELGTATLGRWAMLRLVRLGPDAARLARAVAVLERAKLDQAAQLAGLAIPDAAWAADLLVRAGVLDEDPLGFAHPLLRGAVYRDMTKSERTAAHGSAARLLAETHASPAQRCRAPARHRPGDRRMGGRTAAHRRERRRPAAPRSRRPPTCAGL